MALAEQRAQVLIEFTGMQVVPRSNPTRIPRQQNPSESHVEEDDSVSIGITKHYNILYKDTEIESQMGASLHAAASMTQERHNLDCDLESLNDDAINSHELASNRMSIQSLLNPKGELDYVNISCLIPLINRPSLHTSLIEPHVDRAPDDSAAKLDLVIESTRELVINSGGVRVLDKKLLCSIRSVHDSEVQKNKGNERRRKRDHPRFEQDNAPAKLNPSDCSKLVSVLVRDVEGLEKSIARLHRWNICVKLDINRLAQNTSTTLDIDLKLLYKSGSVSKQNPLEEGRWVVVIKDSVRHNPFVTMF